MNKLNGLNEKNLRKLTLLIFFSNLIYFFIGFYFQHDFSNGGKIDFEHIYKNFLYFKSNSIFSIDWRYYESSSLPLHYIITKFLIPTTDIYIYKSFIFFISIFCVIIFYFVLKAKYEIYPYNVNLFLLSSIILISSSFRTDAFYGLEENISFMFFFLTIFFFEIAKKRKSQKLILFTIFLSCATFFSRQLFAFLPAIVFFEFLRKDKLISYFNLKLSFIFLIFLIPSFLIFYEWGGILPPGLGNEGSRLTLFQYYTIPKVFGMYVIFLLPFIIFKIDIIKKILKNYKFLLIILFFLIIYFYAFWNIPRDDFGGGPIFKLYNSHYLHKAFYLLISYLGIIFTLILVYKNFNFFLFILFKTIIYLLIDIPFFSYVDPIILIFILIYCFNSKKLFEDTKKSLFIFSYFALLHIGWVFYFSYIIGDIIR